MSYVHTLGRYYKDIYGWETIEDDGSFMLKKVNVEIVD